MNMILLLFFAFISGLITIAAPCIWPLLPIVLSASSTGERSKPLGITLGIIVSFAFFTLSLSYIVKIIPFDPDALRLLAVFIIGFLGLTLIVPQLSQITEGYVSRLSGRFGSSPKSRPGFTGGLITGFALGIVWSPCAGPILATIATLAATRAVSWQIVLVTLVYVIGVGIPLFLFATIGAHLLTKSRALSPYTGRIQQVFGVVMILTALAIYTNYDKVIQVKLLDTVPSYSGLIYTLEGNAAVKKQLDILKNKKEIGKTGMSSGQSDLPILGTAPEFAGISKWLNTSKPLTMAQLHGKVVLVDFWTYTCINCIRTLPHITDWYEKYKNKGFVVVGVHTPEFPIERKTENVADALRRFHITYPVAQDNDLATWNAFNNDAWPAEYLIDARGRVRHVHFGEDEYEESEMAIRSLLVEAGQSLNDTVSHIKDETPSGEQTPETYLGSARMERFVSPELATGKKQAFTIPSDVPKHSFAYGGTWTVTNEQVIAGKGALLELNFYANKVFLVIMPIKGGGKVKVFLDDKLIGEKFAGTDVSSGMIKFDMPRLYNLVDLRGKKGQHRLRLEFETEGISIYAFTFG